MTLDKLNKTESCIVLRINSEQESKARLNSFGIMKDAKIIVQEVTLAKKTIKISVNKTNVALRISEAANIEVEKC